MNAVFLDGPFSWIDPVEGIELPMYSVFVGDEEGEPVGKVYNVKGWEKAESLAKLMCKDRRLPLECSAFPVRGAW